MQTGTFSYRSAADDQNSSLHRRPCIANSPYRDENLDDPGIPAGNPVRPGGPIKHVIYIVKENRTYDQVLGDIKKGNGDASLVLFGENITPNLHKMARDFVLFDNFYVNSDVSADGHNWATAAIAPDYTQKLCPTATPSAARPTITKGRSPPTPARGLYLDNAAQAGLTMRNYGYFAASEDAGTDGDADQRRARSRPGARDRSQLSRLRSRLSRHRARQSFHQRTGRFRETGNDAAVADHAHGQRSHLRRRGRQARAAVLAADNDQGVGMLVEAVSKSRFWNETAIFVIEDDAQNGPDHVDSHRSPCWLISPYVKPGAVDSSMYNHLSAAHHGADSRAASHDHLRRGRPAHVRRLQYTPDARPMRSRSRVSRSIRATPPTPPPPGAPTIWIQRRRRVDDDELNAVLWAAIKGPDVPLPAPVTSRFSH